MWDLILAGSTAVLGILVSILFILYDRQHLKDILVMNTIPGPSPVDHDGNLSQINEEGGLVSYLLNLHNKWGDLASFWIGKQFIVTTSAPVMFKKVKKLEYRPGNFLEKYKHFLGESSIWFANGSDWRIRYDCYKESFNREYLFKYYDTFNKLSQTLATRWQNSTSGGISFSDVSRDVRNLTCEAMLINLFGDSLADEKRTALAKSYEQCLHLSESLQIDSDKKTEKMKELLEESLVVRDLMGECIKARAARGGAAETLLIDRIMERAEDEHRRVDDCLAFVAGGLHKMTTMLVWSIVYLGTNIDVQKRLRKEICASTNVDDTNYDDVNSIKYLRQFINETLRCSKMSPFLVRRTVTEIRAPGGIRVIPEKTPVIQCLAHEFQDSDLWENPTKFDPDRFCPDKMEKQIGRSFEPFGFAGKRRCPGMRYTYLFTSVFLVHLLRNCKVSSDHSNELESHFGFVHKITSASDIRVSPLTTS